MTGTVAPLRQGRPAGSGKLSAYMAFLIAQVEHKPDITMPELADKLDEVHGVRGPAFFAVACPGGPRVHI